MILQPHIIYEHFIFHNFFPTISCKYIYIFFLYIFMQNSKKGLETENERKITFAIVRVYLDGRKEK